MNKRILITLFIAITVLVMIGSAVSADEGENIYISVSFDGQYARGVNDKPVAYLAVPMDELKAIDLDEYGLGNYYYDGDYDGNYDITALHLYVYTHENIFGLSWDDVRVSGGSGSIFFEEGLFGFEDCNLNYYLNGVYPELYPGWGTTADNLTLKAGDFYDIAGYTSWSFWSDSAAGFNYFADENGDITHEYTANAGEDLSVKLVRSGGGFGGELSLNDVPWFEVYYGTVFGEAEGSIYTDDTGNAILSGLEEGRWYLWCDGGYGAEYSEDIVSSPAFARVTVEGGMVIEIPAPELVTDNYTVNITSGEAIDVIRYAPGIYTSASEIKNAEGMVDISAGIVDSHVADGVFSYEMPDGGIYSLWVRMDADHAGVKKEYILTADLSYMEQTASAYGVTLTVKNLYGVKDFFIAPGHHTSYSEIKPLYVVNITSAKIGNKHDYSYILSEPGDYTVWVRYEDPARPAAYIHTSLEVREPEFTQNGLQIKIGNLDDVKVIRTAAGEFATAGDIKRAAGSRGFSGKNMGEEYMIQYRTPGAVTVAVVYNHGYTVIYKYDVYYNADAVKITAEENRVTLSGLDKLQVSRYAPGKYKTAAGIKTADGVKVIRATDPVNGTFSVEGLKPGLWTFYVQMNDESKEFFYITVE